MLEAIFSWATLWWIMLVVYIVSCLGLIIIVLLQKGKGMGFAGAFGLGGGSETVFGPRMSQSLPVKMTYVMAGLFLALALGMSLISHRVGGAAAPEKVEIDEAQQAEMESLQQSFEDMNLGDATAQPEEEQPALPAGTVEPEPVLEQPEQDEALEQDAGESPAEAAEPAEPEAGAPN